MLLNILETSFNIDFDHGLGKRVLKFGFINLRISELLDLSKKKKLRRQKAFPETVYWLVYFVVMADNGEINFIESFCLNSTCVTL